MNAQYQQQQEENFMEMSMGFIFEDPISMDYMEDAVMIACGHSFSQETLNGWMEKQRDGEEIKCPVCNYEIKEGDVKPNYKLREAIEKYKLVKEHGDEEKEKEQQAKDKEKQEMQELLERLGEEKQDLAQENARLAELERQYQEEVEDMRRRQLRLERDIQESEEREERERRERELKEKGEVDQILQKAIEERRRYEEMERKHKDSQSRCKLLTQQMEDLKSRYRLMEGELADVKGKYRVLAMDVKKKEEEEKKNSSSLFSYIPFTTPSVPSFNLAALVGWSSAVATLGPLVQKFSSYRLDGRRGLHRNSPVWKATKIEGGEVVAVKKLVVREGNMMVFREAMLHHNLCHPNILELQGLMQGVSKQEYFMILPFLEFDLDHAINSSATRFNAAQVRHFMYQVLLVVCYLHSGGVVHRDIQPSSVMVSNTGNGRIWLSSLGCARSLASKPLDPISPSSYLGYRAPEIILSAGHLQRALLDNDWKAADIWSCGCIFAQLLTRKVLFSGSGSDQILKSILSFQDCRDSLGEMGVTRFTALNTHPAFSEEPQSSLADLIKKHIGQNKEEQVENSFTDAHSLLQQMLCFDPERRISALEALNHPYFACYEAMMKKKAKLWKCPTSVAAVLEDENVAKFMQEFSAGLIM